LALLINFKMRVWNGNECYGHNNQTKAVALICVLTVFIRDIRVIRGSSSF